MERDSDVIVQIHCDAINAFDYENETDTFYPKLKSYKYLILRELELI